MKTLLFTILFIGLVLMLISLLTINAYLLGLAELIIIPTMIIMIIKNLRNYEN